MRFLLKEEWEIDFSKRDSKNFYYINYRNSSIKSKRFYRKNI